LCLFPAMLVPASSAFGHGFWLDFHLPVETPRVCTTHVLRRCHQREGECSETEVTASAAEKRIGVLVPSPQRGGCTELVRQ
jgi:hypothetical protein